MKKFVKVISSVLVISIAFGISACSKTNTDNQSSNNNNTQTNKNLEITVAWWGSDNRHEAMKEVARLYMEKNPGTTIKTEYDAFDGFQQKLLTRLAAKNSADVMQVNYNWVHSFGKGKNVFYNLRELSDKIDLTNWKDIDLEAMTVGGELGAVPHGVTARANLYNTKLFEEFNIEFPKTYDDIIKAGQIIGQNNTPTGAENKYVQANIGSVSTDLYIAQMLYNHTGKVMQTDGRINYTQEEVAYILDIYKSFEDAGAFPKYTQEDPIQNESNPVWTSGRLGSVYEWIGTMDKYLSSYKGGNSKEEISVATYVTQEPNQNIKIYAKPSLGYAVSKTSKNPQLAADYINFMFTDEDAIKALGTSLGISSNLKTFEFQNSQEGFIKGAMKMGYSILGNYELVMLDPYFEDENVRGQRYSAIEKFRSGKSSSFEAAKDYIEKQQSELDKLYK